MEAPTPQIPLPSKWAPSPPQAPPNPAPPPPPPPPADSPKVKQEHVTTALMTQTLPPYKRGTHSSEITPPGNLQEQVKEAIKRHLNAPQPLPSRWAPIQPGPIVADGLAIKKENASELPKQSAPVSALETPEALPVKAFSSILGQSEWATNTQPYLPTLERAQKQETLPQSKSSAPLPSKWAPQSTTSSDTIQPSQPPSLQINEPNRSEPKSLTDNVTTSKSPIALTSSAISSMAAITPSEKRFKTPSSVASSYATSATPPPRAPSSIASQSPSVASSVYSPAASKKSAAIPIRRSDYIRPMPVSSKNPWANNPKIGINTSRSGSQEHATPSRQKSPSVLGPVKPSTSKPLAKTSSNALSIVSSEFKHQSSQTDATKMESEKPTIEKIEELAIAKPVSGEDINSGAAKSTIETVIKVEMETEDSMQTARKLGGGKLQPLQHDGDGEEDATASTKLKDNDAQMDVSVQEPLLPSKPFYENLHARYAFATPRQINALARRFGTLCLGELEGMTRSI
ncbi:hypothetical protein DFH27DRAFT_535407 [Peziza echinospora]|nr:hypothetical protein DFH27DRAFT_535407 [Peziza echinospora]